MKYLTSLILCALLTASVNSSIGFTNTPADSVAVVNITDARTALQIFDDSVQNLYDAINLESYNLSADAFRFAMMGHLEFVNSGKLANSNIISIIDFTQPSTQKRFYTIDLKAQKVIFNTLVSHGKNTGENIATSFSNKVHSNQSSLGFYITGETYVGSKGYSLRLDGMDPGYNDNIRNRAVVMHDADYVSEAWIAKYGRLGRSQGCPALPKEISKTVIDTIKDRTLVFAYAKDQKFLSASSHLQIERILQQYQLASR